MRSYMLILLMGLALSIVCGCRQTTNSTALDTPAEQSQTKVFLNIDVPKIGSGVHRHFIDVHGYGSQAKSEPGTANGFMAMNGRKFQRFQVEGTITEDGRKAIYSQLQSELNSVIDNNGATIVGEIRDSIRDRPIWYLLVIVPGETTVDLEKLEGFYFEYADDSGNGFVDVMATKSVGSDSKDTWHIGFAIHEPHNMK